MMPDGGEGPCRGYRALAAERDAAVAERSEAIKMLGEASQARGEAEGRLAASEMAGVVDGWRTRALTAEAERDALRVVAEAARAYGKSKANNPSVDLLNAMWDALDALPPGLGQSD